MARIHDDGGAPVSGELQSLDYELRGILIEERCSFGPELRSQLAGEYRRLRGGGRRTRTLPSWWRFAAVAAVVALGSMLSVPRFWTSLNGSLGAAAIPELTEPMDPLIVGGTVLKSTRLARGDSRSVGTDLGDGVALVEGSAFDTLPVLQDRNRARQILADEIPPRLYEQEGGGTVHLLIWVSPEGAVEIPQIDRSSGLAELDLAALRAIRSFRFAPATRRGVPVGAWFRFPVGFQPRSTRLLLDGEAQSVSLPGSD